MVHLNKINNALAKAFNANISIRRSSTYRPNTMRTNDIAKIQAKSKVKLSATSLFLK